MLELRNASKRSSSKLGSKLGDVSHRQRPLIRAGSGDVHEARLAVLEGRFSEETKARCSWCNQVRQAKLGEWLEILISSPGTGIRPACVFRCLECEAAPISVASRSGIVAVPRGARAPGDKPRPVPAALPAPLADSLNPLISGASAKKKATRTKSTPKMPVGKPLEGSKVPPRPKGGSRLKKHDPFLGTASPASAG